MQQDIPAFFCCLVQLFGYLLAAFALLTTGWVWLWWAYFEKYQDMKELHPLDLWFNRDQYTQDLPYSYHNSCAMRCERCQMAIEGHDRAIMRYLRNRALADRLPHSFS